MKNEKKLQNKRAEEKKFPTFCAKRVDLKTGCQKVETEDDDDDDSPDLSSLLNLGQKSPFSMISSNLYNVDYNNRIIVIDEEIDERCFIYAKMIENWNRLDKKVFELKEQINKLIEEYDEIKPVFEGFKLDDEDEEDALTKIQKKAETIIEKHPEVLSILAELKTLKISQYEISSYEPPPIRLKFNLPGGWILAYQTLDDVISLSKTKVIGINMGMAYSAAAFLLVACHERLALPNSRMMIHRGSGGNYGTYEQTESSQQNYKEQVDEMIAAFRKRTNISMKVLKKNMNPDWYLSAKSALKYGLIDRIVTSIDEII